MGVKSARVQQGVAGDDLVFTHTLQIPAVVGVQEASQLTVLEEGDTAIGFYASFQGCPPVSPAVPDTQSAVVNGDGESSTFEFMIPKLSSAMMQPGHGQTVRIEITRAGGAKETIYLYDEYDLLYRGFPSGYRGPDLP